MHPTFASYNNRIFYTSRVSAFSFYLKKKTPAKEKQTQGCAPRPRERHAAALSLRLSVSCSAHSPVNSLRSNSTGNVAEAPPVADEARRCWRKTRSIAPAPRAIGDYVLRGLDGLRSKMHEPVLFERGEFTCECAEQLTESRKLCTAAWRCRGVQGSLMDSTINSNFLYTSPPQKYKTAATVTPLRL